MKGDVSGLSRPGDPAGKANEALIKRAAQIGMTDFAYRGYPVVFWDLFGQQGHPVRTTVTEMGPLLLARMMELSERAGGGAQHRLPRRRRAGAGAARPQGPAGDAGLARRERQRRSAKTYGNVAPASVGAIQRALLVLENQGAAGFLGEPALDLKDLIATDANGMGRINVLMSDRLMQSPRLYAMFLLWLLSELFEQLPEVGDPDKPVLVFFFDEAHLLFTDAPKALIDKVVQVVRLDPLQGRRGLLLHPEPRRRAAATCSPSSATASSTRCAPSRRATPRR